MKYWLLLIFPFSLLSLCLDELFPAESEGRERLFQYCEIYVSKDPFEVSDLDIVALLDQGLLVVFADHIISPNILLIPQDILVNLAGPQFWARQKHSQESAIEYDDKTIDFLERSIPELAEAAFKRAYWDALASGSSVLIVRGDALLEIYPDGTEKFIKNLLPSILVTKGQKIKIK